MLKDKDISYFEKSYSVHTDLLTYNLRLTFKMFTIFYIIYYSKNKPSSH